MKTETTYIKTLGKVEAKLSRMKEQAAAVRWFYENGNLPESYNRALRLEELSEQAVHVATPITACFIRLANLMNSEIIGKPSDVPWAFVFERVDMLPRHPGQLYEAIAYLILFFIMIYLYKNYSKKLHRGFFFGLCLTYIFTFRFFIEFLKENQEDFENSMMFNMGQWLSVPFIIIGVYFMFFYDKKKNKIA